MKAFRYFTIAGILLLGLPACDRNESAAEVDKTPEEVDLIALESSSKKLARSFPILPLVEKDKWAALLELESAYVEASGNPVSQNELAGKINSIISELNKSYPFSVAEDEIRLGEIRYHKASGIIELPATVTYPKMDPDGKVHELEVVLCTDKGRLHETLLMTEARPLHLEILLHLVGSKKQESQYRVAILLPGDKEITLESLLKTTTGEDLPVPMLFKFSGSTFNGNYRPDSTGDLIITWHAQDAVLQVVDEKIAQARTRLLVTKVPELEEGIKVHLALIPVSK